MQRAMSEIVRVMIDKLSGKVAYAVMNFGGYLGVGEDYYPLPWSLLTYNPALGGYEVNIGEERLKGAPNSARARPGIGPTPPAASGFSTITASRLTGKHRRRRLSRKCHLHRPAVAGRCFLPGLPAAMPFRGRPHVSPRWRVDW